jgi:sugar lactone lactonase YvrE
LPPLRHGVVKRFRASVAGEERCTLGEGPVWDGDRNRVLWVDISAGAVHTGTLDGELVAEDSLLKLPETVGAVACARDGELLVAGARRLYRVSPEGAVSVGPQLIADSKASRLNDGACDPAGRFLVGSLALDRRAHEEVLVRIDAEGRIDTIDHDLGMSNGLAFTPAGDLLYSIDTVSRIVWSREYDSRTGSVGRRREFLRVDGSPDGMCADEQGNLWIAMWGAGQVRCYSPEGEQHAVVDVPAPNTTSVAFVGPTLETLLITTASEQLSATQRARYSNSGRLFIAHVEVRGLPVPAWTGARAWPGPLVEAMTAES